MFIISHSLVAKERDEASRNPRKNEIGVEIRHAENKIDALKRQIEDDLITRDMLRGCADIQSKIDFLKGQCDSDLASLEESVQEHGYRFQKYNLDPVEVRGEHTPDRRLADRFDALVDVVSSRCSRLKEDVTKASQEVARLDKQIAEKSILVANNKRNLLSSQSRVEELKTAGGSVDNYHVVVSTFRDNEVKLGRAFDVDPGDPQAVLALINQRLDENEEDYIDSQAPRVVKRMMKKLRSMVRIG